MNIEAETIAKAMMLAERMRAIYLADETPIIDDYLAAISVYAQCSVVLKHIPVAVKEPA